MSILSEFLLFLAAIISGTLLCALYFFAARIAKNTGLKAISYIFDILWCAAAFCAYAALSVFLCGGAFKAFVLTGLISGLGIGSLFAALFGHKASGLPPDKKQPQ